MILLLYYITSNYYSNIVDKGNLLNHEQIRSFLNVQNLITNVTHYMTKYHYSKVIKIFESKASSPNALVYLEFQTRKIF